jgi:predicted dehydrogenase
VAFVGAGNYATSVLIPAFRQAGVRLHSVASRTGVSGVHAGKKYGFEETTTDTESLITNDDINVIVVTTRHDTHARFVLQAILSGKHVFVEKPLCLSLDELAEIRLAMSEHTDHLLMVGFNRRFAPQIVKSKQLLDTIHSPKSLVLTVNAGFIPREHWTQDPDIGGGRIVGEACHFIDLLRFLVGSPIRAYSKATMDHPMGDTVSLQFSFADGSIGTVHYLANGNKSFPKERLEVFADGRILQLDNFRRLAGFGWPGFDKMNLWRQDKGQRACVAAFVEAVRLGTGPPIPFGELDEISRISITVAKCPPSNGQIPVSANGDR